jgi:hypothetical protein
MKSPTTDRSRSRILRVMAILLPVITVLALLLLVLLDDGADVPTTFNYQLY